MEKNEGRDEVLNEEEMDDAATTIILTDEDGQEVEFEFLDLIPYQEKEYMVLMPLEGEDDEEETEVVILQYEEGDEEGTETYSGVIDEEVLEAIFNIFKEKWNDHFNFVED